MIKMKHFAAAGIAAFTLAFAAPASAEVIFQILQRDTGFSFLHTTDSSDGMFGKKLTRMAVDPDPLKKSTYIGSEFTLHTLLFDYVQNVPGNFPGNLPVQGKMSLIGDLDFTVPNGDILGTLTVTFDDDARAFLKQRFWDTKRVDVTLPTSTEFLFVNELIMGLGPDVPPFNSLTEDNQLLSLWGANTWRPWSSGGGRFVPLRDGLGIDLVVEWAPLPEPGSLELAVVGLLGLLGFGVVVRRRRALAAAAA